MTPHPCPDRSSDPGSHHNDGRCFSKQTHASSFTSNSSRRTLRGTWERDVRWTTMREVGKCVTLTFTLTLLCALACGVKAAGGKEEESVDTRDFRFTGFEDLMVEGNRFEDPRLVGYTQLVLDEARNQVLVGAKDALFRLAQNNLDPLEITDWSSPEDVKTGCSSSGQDEKTCHNFVRVLLLHGDSQVFTCGTNAFSPTCTWRMANQLGVVNRTISGKAICPYSPLHNTTALMTNNGELYTATIIDKLAQDPSINRNLGTAPSLRTEQMNSKWLNEPSFVSTYEFGNFVYFFFREIAVEYINCGKKVYSRVARVCKTDRGGTVLLEGKWTTFHKARLNCSIPGNFPFYFDELQSTFYSSDEQLVYAIFSTPPNSIAGSAVCAYNMSALETAFNGPFKHQKDSMSAWMRHENGHSETRKCVAETGGMKRSSEKSANHLVMAQKYQLMDQAVQPVALTPVIVRERERWTHLVVDHVATKRDLLDVLFLATENGKIQKMMRLPPSPSDPNDPNSPPSPPVTCLVEDIKIVANGHPRPVKAMKFSVSKGAIYLATDGNILKVPVQRCSRFRDSRSCLAARDPYCGWDSVQRRCSPPPGGNPHADNWEQDISACPDLNYPEDGGWSMWSDWSKCKQVGGDPMVEQCLCRSRLCDSPKATNGGRPCVGAGIEVANCTIHGQWTDWSEWSACSQTCGLALRERKRQCGNPPPKYGGRACVGADTEKTFCKNHPACPLPPVDGRWSVWSGWSSCTKDCNGGIQTRRRLCNQPKPSRGGQLCSGNKQEWRMCNTQECDEISRISPWTEWIQTNRTAGGYFEQRFRFTCRANVPKRKMIKTSYAKSQARFCQNNGLGCQTADAQDSLSPVHEDGVWSSWAQWSPCSETCGGGMQWRNRSCDSPPPSGFGHDCQGHEREGRHCNTEPCTGTWSCWSPFGPCSVTCGSGVKTRSRQCQSSERGVACEGEAVESEGCDMGECPVAGVHPPAAADGGDDDGGDDDGGDGGDVSIEDVCNTWQWSHWTACVADDSNEEGRRGGGVQYRHRKPPLGLPLQPSPPCLHRLQMRTCELSTASTPLPQPDLNVGAVLSAGPVLDPSMCTNANSGSHDNQDSQNNVRHLGVLYLVITGLISFILGGVAFIGLYLYIHQLRKQRRSKLGLWATETPYSDNNLCNNASSVSDNTCPPLPKMNNVASSEDSLEMRMLNYRLSELSDLDAFGSLRKGKVTVSEASTLQRNSMWTNLTITDDKY